MKKLILAATTLLITTSAWAVNGTFIQLNRAVAEKSVEDWQADLKQMKDVGIDTVIVQWSSEPPIMYFTYPTNTMPYLSESHAVLETLFEANVAAGLDVYLGLQNNPLYWSQIKGRDRVLRDFFYLRTSRNERLQLGLLDTFGNQESWVGYYIPDEIDDFTWRHDSKRPMIKRYVGHMCERLRANDPERKIAMSAFFRGRTAPHILADNLLDIASNSGLDHLLIQDGVGVGDPPVNYVPFYFKVLKERWANVDVEQPDILDFVAGIEESNQAIEDGVDVVEVIEVDPANELVLAHAPAEEAEEELVADEDTAENAAPVLPELWVVIEAFKQTSKGEEPFAAKPTSPTQLKKQVRNSAEYFENTVLFTFQDYMDPDLGDNAAKLFNTMKKMHEKSQASTN